MLPRLAVRHLQEHKKRQDAERQALGEAWRDHGLVFASSIGTPVEPRNVNRRWDELRRRAGLDWLRLHDLRHGCATLLLAKGVPDRVIMEVLGHAEIGVTMNTYAHVLPVLRQEAADAIDELFGADVSRFGSSIGNSKGHFMIASGLLPGALGGTRTPNLLIRSQMLYPLSYERTAYEYTAAGRLPVRVDVTRTGAGLTWV